MESSWRYVREDRTSGRQRCSIPFDGVLGEAPLAGDLTPLWPFLEVGQWIGLGASTGHGMGCYAAEGSKLPPVPD